MYISAWKKSLRITLGSERRGSRVRRGSPPFKRSPSSTQKKTLRSFLARVCPVLACPPFLKITAEPLKSGCDTRVGLDRGGDSVTMAQRSRNKQWSEAWQKGAPKTQWKMYKRDMKSACTYSLNAAGLEGLQCVCSISFMREGSSDPITPLSVIKFCFLHSGNTSI